MVSTVFRLGLGLRSILLSSGGSLRPWSSLFQPRFTHQEAGPKKVMFLGTPEFANIVLGGLLEAAKQPGSGFEVCAVVSNYGNVRTNSSGELKRCMTAVESFALCSGVPEDRVLTAKSGSEASFLARVRELSPDLCVTAGFGHILPQQFLDVPPLGTVNLHASLLPQFRGAAPVVRALEAGVTETGISLAFTVLRCDAGPVLQQAQVSVEEGEGGAKLTDRLMHLGVRMLVDNLPDLLAGRARARAVPQDDSAATQAPKLTLQDKWVDFAGCSAQQVHNKVHALLGSDKTRLACARFNIVPRLAPGQVTPAAAHRKLRRVNVLLLSTRVVSADDAAREPVGLPHGAVRGEVLFCGGRALVPCQGGTYLELLLVEEQRGVELAAKDLAAQLHLGRTWALLPVTADEAASEEKERGLAAAAKAVRKAAKGPLRGAPAGTDS